MNPELSELNIKLAELEQVVGVWEHDIEASLRQLRKTSNEEEPCQEWKSELMAFSFMENYQDKKTGWGTYFGPMMTWQKGNGEVVESPSLSLVDGKMISYWDTRSKTTNNPLLKARYAGLVWDLSERTTGQKPHFSTAIATTEALLQIAEHKFHKHEVDIIRKLERALYVAISIIKTDLIDRAKKAILDYETSVAQDSKLGLWGFSFDLLIGNKKANLSTTEESSIIDELEKRLARLQGGDPWACEHAAERLARYYRTKNRENDVSRVIRLLGSEFERAASNAAPLAASSWLEHVHRIYIQYNLFTDAERVTKALRIVGPKIQGNMKTVSHKVEIPPQEFESYIEQIIAGDVEESFVRIAVNYIPKKEEIKKQLTDLAKKAPLSFLIKKHLTDHQGRVVAEIGALEDDLDGNIVHHMSQNMAFSVIFLSTILDRAIEKFNLTDKTIVGHFYKSAVFMEQQRDILTAGIASYLQKDFLLSIHLLVPQIEAVVRNLVETSGGAVLRPGRGGGFHLKTLDDLLRSPELVAALGEDATLYFRVLLTDQRGWNIRNNVCHGLMQPAQMSKNVADRLLHILLVMSLLRENE